MYKIGFGLPQCAWRAHSRSYPQIEGMLPLNAKVEKYLSQNRNMTKSVAGNYIRAHRRRYGLTQRELGILVGYTDGFAVGRHERSSAAPPLVVALAYEIVFEIPTANLFAGFRSVVAQSVARNKQELRAELLRLGGKSADPSTKKFNGY